MNSDLFKSNIDRWSLLFPKEAEQLSKLEFKNQPTLDSPAKEDVHTWFSQLDLHEIQILFIYGLQSGYSYEMAKEWLEKESNFLIIIEDDLGAIHHFFQTEQGSEMMYNKQVFLCPLDRNDRGGHIWFRLAQLVGVRPFTIVGSPSYLQSQTQMLQAITSNISFYVNWNQGMLSEFQNHGMPFYNNFYQNLNHLPHAYLGKEFFGRFKGIPAIICGAGPSLDKNLSVLKTLSNKAMIFAGATAMNAVNQQGFVPHFGVGIDPNAAQWTRLIMNTAYEVPFLYRARLYPPALQQIHGPTLYVNGAGSHQLPNWYERRLGIEGKEVAEGFNVVNFSISLACEMGCNPIILVGMDLAYTDRKSYASGVVSHPIHSKHYDFRTKSIEDELIVKDDIFGNPVITLWKWVSESNWIAECAYKNSDKLFINATEGGIGMPGIPNKPLTEVVDYLLPREFDLRLYIHGELQNSAMPESVNYPKIEKISEVINDSFKSCQKIYLLHRDNFKELAIRSTNRQEIQAEFDQVAEQLKMEGAYLSVLKEFEVSYRDRVALELEQINYDPNLTEQEKASKIALLYSGICQRLYDSATIQSAVIEMHIFNKSPPIVTSKEKEPLDLLHVTEGEYSLVDNTLTMRDPDLNIDIQETLSEEVIVDRKFYPNQILKIEQYFYKGHLHGPTTFFSLEGNVLARSWFVNGQQQGKAFYYYATGELYATQRFFDNELQGPQHWYYKHGQLKTHLNYLHGKLDGDIWLYFSDGQLKREQHFYHGEREGIERIWSPTGLVIIEANYHQNKPVGKARKWHTNGQIAQEISYSEDSRVVSVQSWDEIGNPLSDHIQEDVIDAITRETNTLASSLDVLCEKLEIVAPLLMKEMNTELNLDKILKDIHVLRTEVTHLKEMSTSLQKESGLHSENDLEPIWKTPSSRRLLQKQLEVLTTELRQGVGAIQALLNEAIRKYKEKRGL